MSNNNPKAFYNQAAYTSGSGSQNDVYKPDEPGASELYPPPPYVSDSEIPDHADSSNAYGAVYHNEASSPSIQQAGLLSPSSHPFNSAPSFKPSPRQESPHQEYNASSQQHEQHPQQQTILPNPISLQRVRRNGDPGCCKQWCKYIFAALLVWLVFIKFGSYLSDSLWPHHNTCNSNKLLTWQDIPQTIEFEKNVEIIVHGSVTGGRVLISPLEDRHGGSIVSKIEYAPNSLADDMSYRVKTLGDVTTLTIEMPQNLRWKEECVHVDIEIRLPYSADLVRVDIPNVAIDVRPFIKSVRVLDLKTSNGHVELNNWSGESLKLISSNGYIKTNGKIEAGNDIYIQTSNSPIEFVDNVIAKKKLWAKTSNGAIKSYGLIETDDSVLLTTSNGQVRVSNIISNTIYIQSSNAKVDIVRSEAKESITVQSSNAGIDLAVVGDKNIRIVAQTSNADVNVHAPKEFEGAFHFKTSSTESIRIENGGDQMDYTLDRDNEKRGERNGYGNKGDLTVTTSSKGVYVSFDA